MSGLLHMWPRVALSTWKSLSGGCIYNNGESCAHGHQPLPKDNERVEYHSLAVIIQSLKGYTAFKANRLLGSEGEFWAHESYDHWIRNDVEWQRTVAYVLNNPLKAGYVERWQDWEWSFRRV